MAAYAALVSLMNDLDLIPNHPFHSFYFDDKQITSLSQTVHFLIDFIESHGCSGVAAQLLEARIAFTSNIAHYLIECHVNYQIRCGLSTRRKSRSYFLLDLQKVIDNMIFVKRKAMQFQAQRGLKKEKPAYSQPTTATPLKPPASRKNVMVGFKDGVVQLLDILTRDPSTWHVIPVVGMGGMGKTTLTKHVFDHSLIHHHFDVRLWATISQQHSLETSLKQLLGEASSASGGDVNLLGVMLHKVLWNRRYLVVLDDVWSIKAWDEIKEFLPDNNNGSCVVVTTRLYNMATHLSSVPFTMKFLDEAQSWELFSRVVFGGEDCPSELQDIGERIVRRCKRLPLLIVVIGGYLRRSPKEIEYWEKVFNFKNPVSSLGDDEQCLELLSSSYQHLPACLKPCFLFIGAFEEDELIDASNLVRLWIAQGFVRGKEGLSLEEVAEGYLEDLIERNLILVSKRRWNGKAEVCVIHDIVREMCLMVGMREHWNGKVEVYEINDIFGAMCKMVGNIEKFTYAAGPAQIATRRERRSVILEYDTDRCYGPIFAWLGSLGHPLEWKPYTRRDVYSVDQLSLDLGSPIRSTYFNTGYNGAHFQQVNLRYLDFHVVQAQMEYYVPSSLCLFWNMQMLIISTLVAEICAPYEIWEMSQIRHLELRGLWLPCPLPQERPNQQGCVVLQNLHTLLGVKNFRLTEDVCERMPNIKKISLVYANLPADREASSYYCLENLGLFSKLESLECKFGEDSKWHDVACSFVFPDSLEEMILRNCHLDWEELTEMIKFLSRLGSLELHDVRGQEWDLSDEEFPRLQTLGINTCYDLVDWNADSSNFPVLECLHIYATPKLLEIPYGIGTLSTLRYISIWYSMFAAISAASMVVERESLGDHDLRLYVCFWRKEKTEEFQSMVEEKALASSNIADSYSYTLMKLGESPTLPHFDSTDLFGEEIHESLNLACSRNSGRKNTEFSEYSDFRKEVDSQEERINKLEWGSMHVFTFSNVVLRFPYFLIPYVYPFTFSLKM